MADVFDSLVGRELLHDLLTDCIFLLLQVAIRAEVPERSGQRGELIAVQMGERRWRAVVGGSHVVHRELGSVPVGRDVRGLRGWLLHK